MRTIKVEFTGKGFKRVRLQPADEKGTLMGERIDFVFGEAFKKVGLRVTDVDTGEELYNNKFHFDFSNYYYHLCKYVLIKHQIHLKVF